MGVSGVTNSRERFCMNSVLARAAARRRLLAAVSSRTVASRRSTKDLLYSRGSDARPGPSLSQLLHVDGLLDVAVAADGEREAAVAVRCEHHWGTDRALCTSAAASQSRSRRG